MELKMQKKAKYEKPRAVALGPGIQGQTNCAPGSGVNYCSVGGVANQQCSAGTTPRDCKTGSTLGG